MEPALKDIYSGPFGVDMYKLRLELFGSSHSYASRYADSCLCIAGKG